MEDFPDGSDLFESAYDLCKLTKQISTSGRASGY